MSTTYEFPTGTTPESPTAQPPPKSKKKWLVPVLAGVLGLGIGAAGGSGATQSATPPASTVVTKTVEVPGPVKTVEDTAKLDAANKYAEAVHKAGDKVAAKADALINVVAQAMALAAKQVNALANGDLATAIELEQQLRDLNPTIGAARDGFDQAVSDLKTTTHGRSTN